MRTDYFSFDLEKSYLQGILGTMPLFPQVIWTKYIRSRVECKYHGLLLYEFLYFIMWLLYLNVYNEILNDNEMLSPLKCSFVL